MFHRIRIEDDRGGSDKVDQERTMKETLSHFRRGSSSCALWPEVSTLRLTIYYENADIRAGIGIIRSKYGYW